MAKLIDRYQYRKTMLSLFLNSGETREKLHKRVETIKDKLLYRVTWKISEENINWGASSEKSHERITSHII